MIFNKKEDYTELSINDEIGFWGISHQDFTNQLKDVDGDIKLNIASYGGVVTDAFAIYNSLKSHKGRVIANIYGDSASSATLIAMAADEIRIADNVMFLIHNVWGGVTGEAEDLRKYADDMDKVNANIINVYKKKTGLNKNTIKALMNKGDWMTAKEAKENKLVDKIVEPENLFNRSEALLMNSVNAEMKAALLEKVNKLNNNKNQSEMNEETKGFLATLKDDILNAIKPKEEVVVEEVVENKEEAISKEDVSEMANSLKAEFDNTISAKDAKIAELEAKANEAAELKAELDKLKASKTEVKGEEKSPNVEPEAKEEGKPLFNFLANKLNA